MVARPLKPSHFLTLDPSPTHEVAREPYVLPLRWWTSGPRSVSRTRCAGAAGRTRRRGDAKAGRREGGRAGGQEGGRAGRQSSPSCCSFHLTHHPPLSAQARELEGKALMSMGEYLLLYMQMKYGLGHLVAENTYNFIDACKRCNACPTRAPVFAHAPTPSPPAPSTTSTPPPPPKPSSTPAHSYTLGLASRPSPHHPSPPPSPGTCTMPTWPSSLQSCRVSTPHRAPLRLCTPLHTSAHLCTPLMFAPLHLNTSVRLHL